MAQKETKQIQRINSNNVKVKTIDEENYIVTAIISTVSVDRHGEQISSDAWDITNFMRHPVLLSSHQYGSLIHQIGKVLHIDFINDEVQATMQYFVGKGNMEADWAWRLVQEGIAAYSIGFIPRKYAPTPNGKLYTSIELLEISQVLIPANASALQKALVVFKSFIHENMQKNIQIKGAIPYHKYPLADPNEKWDAAKEVKQATVEQLKEMCAWYDSEKPDVKSSYKLPHHHREGYKTNWNGVKSAMAVLLGAMGGTNIPAGDRKKVYKHLAKHYEDFGKEPPQFKQYGSDEDILKACLFDEIELKQILNSKIVTKAGRVLSAQNEQTIKNAINAMQMAILLLNQLLSSNVQSDVQQKSVSRDTQDHKDDIANMIEELIKANIKN